jgi:hypothetical protein
MAQNVGLVSSNSKQVFRKILERLRPGNFWSRISSPKSSTYDFRIPEIEKDIYARNIPLPYILRNLPI